MVEVVEADSSGRVVIPKALRRELGIRERTKFILSNRGGGQLLLQKLDIDRIAKKLEDELSGKDIDTIVGKVRKEVNEKIKARYPDLHAR